MLLFQFLIVFEIIQVPLLEEVSDWEGNLLFISGVSTLFSILTMIVTLQYESSGLKEHWLEYMMLSMKAKQDWVPFGDEIKHRTMDSDINYSLIEFKMPVITNMTGFYMSFIY